MIAPVLFSSRGNGWAREGSLLKLIVMKNFWAFAMLGWLWMVAEGSTEPGTGSQRNQIIIGVVLAFNTGLQIIKMVVEAMREKQKEKAAAERHNREQRSREQISRQVEQVEKKTDVQTAILATAAKDVTDGDGKAIDDYLKVYDHLGVRAPVKITAPEGEHAGGNPPAPQPRAGEKAG